MPQKQKKTSKTTASSGRIGTPALLVLAAGIAGIFWWRKRQHDSKNSKNSGSRSPFKFPAATTAAAKSNTSQNAAASTLPRNKASNNKKNKARKKEEKAKKAEIKAEQKKASSSGKASGSSTAQSGQQDSTAVVNYTYFDTARRDTIIPLHKKKSLTAADVMKPSDTKEEQ